jgi:hypothetical protein
MLDSPPPAGLVTDFTGLSNAFREQVAMGARYMSRANERRGPMPVLLLWGIPAVIFVGGVGYFLVHATH